MTTTTTKTMPPTTADETKRQAAREVVDILHDISVLLNTNLDRTQLSLCVSLIENGVNPEALANVIKDLRGQAADGSGSAGSAMMTPKRKESVKK